jgi:hypothetical protein
MRRSVFWKLRRDVKFWWQRRTRGWDDSDLWNLDCTIADLILPRLKAFAQDPGGYPGESYEQWKADLRTMVATFELIASDRYWAVRSEEEDAELQRGLDLFAKYYRALWN